MSEAFSQSELVQRLTELFVRLMPAGFEILDSAIERHGSWEWTAVDLRRPDDDPPLLVTTATPTRVRPTADDERGVTLAVWYMRANSLAGPPSDASIRWIWLSDRQLRDTSVAEVLQTFLRFSTVTRTPDEAAATPTSDQIAQRPGAVTIDQLVTLLKDEIRFDLPAGALIDESTRLWGPLDSLTFVELVYALETELDMSFDYDRAFDIETFGDLVTLVNEMMRDERDSSEEAAGRDR